MDQIESIWSRKLTVAKLIIFLLDRAENIIGKGENAGYQHFLLFIRPSKTGRIMGSPMAGGWVGGVHFFVRSISQKLF